MTSRYKEPRAEFVLHKTDEPHLAKLSDDMSAALRKVHIPGLSYDDAAIQLGIPIGTLKSRVHRARDKVTTLRAQQAAATTSQDQLESADD